MRINFNAVNFRNNYSANNANGKRGSYPNLKPLSADVVSFTGKNDLMKYPAEEIIDIALKAIKEGLIIGEGREAVTYKIERFPEYCVRRERRYNASELKLSKILNKFDMENHVVARLDEGTTIMHYIPGVPIKITSTSASINEIKRDIHELIANNFDILLTHNPKHFESYVEWGADLTLSGHIHGGMIRLPFLGPLISPERTLFPKYSQGEYNAGEGHMIVSRGLSRGNKGFRLFNRPEIGVIVLKNK